MRHDILFCREGWQAMQKLTDGQEISIQEQNKMKSFFGKVSGSVKVFQRGEKCCEHERSV